MYIKLTYIKTDRVLKQVPKLEVYCQVIWTIYFDLKRKRQFKYNSFKGELITFLELLQTVSGSN